MQGPTGDKGGSGSGGDIGVMVSQHKDRQWNIM